MLQRSPRTWPPDYREAVLWRHREKTLLAAREDYRAEVRSLYARDDDGCLMFIHDWGMTYDPRKAGVPGQVTSVPFALFPKQEELVRFILQLLRDDASGLVEKSRDMGATWVAVWVSVYLFLFWPGVAIGWGSRISTLVDRIGVMDSILEKIRWSLRQVPRELRPAGFGEQCMAHMKIINPETGATIIGEGGDDIGRGGRTKVYFKDESAHYANPEAVESALSDNTNVQIDISSVSGLGTVFHRKREAGRLWVPGQPTVKDATNVFIMDWSDHPGKTREWYEARRRKAVGEGTLHLFAQEVERNYAAAVVGTIIQSEWVRAAIDADEKLGVTMDDGGWVAALDVADNDGSGDQNALAKRRGVKLKYLDEWAERDVGATTRRAILGCEDTLPLDLWYDCVGIGASVKSEANRLSDEDLLPEGLRLRPWDAGAGPVGTEDAAGNPQHLIEDDEDSPLVRDYFANLKAQGWWHLARRFYKTWRSVEAGELLYSVDEMICISSTLPRIRQLEKELCQPTEGKSSRLKMLVNKTPKGMRSPNMGDAVMQCYFPAEEPGGYDASLSWVL